MEDGMNDLRARLVFIVGILYLLLVSDTRGVLQVFHCLEEKETTQHFVLHLGRRSLMAVLPDPIVCFKDARYKQTQVLSLLISI